MANERFEVRDSRGMLLGTIRVLDSTWLLRGVVSFARAKDTRYHGTGFRELPDGEDDLSFQRLDIKVSEWSTRPTVGVNGGYYPGRIDFCLVWDGPIEALRDVVAFEPAAH